MVKVRDELDGRDVGFEVVGLEVSPMVGLEVVGLDDVELDNVGYVLGSRV